MISLSTNKSAHSPMVAQIQSEILMLLVTSAFSVQNRVYGALNTTRLCSMKLIQRLSLLISRPKASNIP
jgi:hypothetical protein